MLLTTESIKCLSKKCLEKHSGLAPMRSISPRFSPNCLMFMVLGSDKMLGSKGVAKLLGWQWFRSSLLVTSLLSLTGLETTFQADQDKQLEKCTPFLVSPQTLSGELDVTYVPEPTCLRTVQLQMGFQVATFNLDGV
jgi:hypothetical protein